MNSVNKFCFVTFFVTFVVFLSQSIDVLAMHSQEFSERPNKRVRTQEMSSNPSLFDQDQELQALEAAAYFDTNTYFTDTYFTDSSSSSAPLPEFIPPDHHGLGGSGSKPRGPGNFFGEAGEGQTYSSSSSSSSSSLPYDSLNLIDSFNTHNTQENQFTQQLPFNPLIQYFNQIDQSGISLSDSQGFNLPDLQAPFRQLPPISSATISLPSSSTSSSSCSNNSLPVAPKDSQKHICTECKKAFSQRRGLNKHIRIHTGEQPFKCKECDKTFSESEALKKHIRIHTGEKPFKCKECDKTFSDPSALIHHKRTHTDEKPYQCTECAKAFKRNDGLTRHQKTAHTAKKIQSPEYDKAFSQRSTLT